MTQPRFFTELQETQARRVALPWMNAEPTSSLSHTHLFDVFLGGEGVEALFQGKRSRLQVLVEGDAAVQQARQRFARVVVLLEV